MSFNNYIIIETIPLEVHQYIINGKSPVEWVMDRYELKTDKKSGIYEDPNEYSEYPEYIFNLLLSTITVSVRTMELINRLPEYELNELK
ncbi:type ISP restriction/modification enzyme [Staphylococcus sp. 17KM0847]|uniref:type ISP restriction/modification enzyme n=1 Tax=Staphylococcus sp. 17KM0847 TaxID=2583989 RepID=UPI0015DEBE75